MSTFQPYKFQLVAVVQEIDEHGAVIGEATVAGDKEQPFIVFGGVDGLIKWAKDFPTRLENAGGQQPMGCRHNATGVEHAPGCNGLCTTIPASA